ncbi:MAG: XRE family transcriptional regulator [Betaproteobacteria bacterium]|nr:XRE family transcriptional regulator [Betaproteobacteria bacterium]
MPIRNGKQGKVSRSISGAPEAPKESSAIEIAIGRQVRKLRMQTGISSHLLAERADISIALLSRIEHGKVSASLGTLSRLANALGVPFNFLFQQVSSHYTATLVKAGAGQQVVRAGTPAGQIYKSLGIPIEGDVRLEPYLIEINEKTQPHNTFQHDGVEMIHMLEGALVYRHGSKTYQMRKGDTLFFDARYPHGPESFEKVPARFLAVIGYTR